MNGIWEKNRRQFLAEPGPSLDRTDAVWALKRLQASSLRGQVPSEATPDKMWSNECLVRSL